MKGINFLDGYYNRFSQHTFQFPWSISCVPIAVIRKEVCIKYKTGELLKKENMPFIFIFFSVSILIHLMMTMSMTYRFLCLKGLGHQ
jgi:hypothetical protein